MHPVENGDKWLAGFPARPTEKGVLDFPDLDGAPPPPDPDVDVNEGRFRHMSCLRLHRS